MALLAAAAVLATLVSGAFGVALLRRWQQRGRENLALPLAGMALMMLCVAAAMLVVGATVGWGQAAFRSFYLFGVVLNVPWLAAGSIAINARSQVVSRVTGAAVGIVGALLALGALTSAEPMLWIPGAALGLGWAASLLAGGPDGRRAAATALLGIYSAVAAFAVASAALTAPLAADGPPAGRDLFPAVARGFAVSGNAVGAVLVIVSAVAASVTVVWGWPPRGAWPLARRDARWGVTDAVARWLGSGRRGVVGLTHHLWGNLLIALGVVLAAAGGAFSFPGATTSRAGAIALAATLLYAGFLSTARAFPASAPRPVVEVYTRHGCGLCRQAEERVAVEARGAEVRLVDVDADPQHQRRYGVRVPVVAVEGREIAELELQPGLVRDEVRAVQRARAQHPGARAGSRSEAAAR